MIEMLRDGPEGSTTLNAEEPDDSVYSSSPSEVYRSRQMLGECWSIWKICESEAEQVNCSVRRRDLLGGSSYCLAFKNVHVAIDLRDSQKL